MSLYRKVPVILDEKQIAILGGKLALLNVERAAVEAEKSAALADFNAKLKTQKAEIATLSSQINDGKYETDVAYTEEFDPERKTVLIRREDDKSLLDVRDMTPNEIDQHRQGKLDLGGPAIPMKPPRPQKLEGETGVVDDDYEPPGTEETGAAVVEDDDDDEDEAEESDASASVEAVDNASSDAPVNR